MAEAIYLQSVTGLQKKEGKMESHKAEREIPFSNTLFERLSSYSTSRLHEIHEESGAGRGVGCERDGGESASGGVDLGFGIVRIRARGSKEYRFETCGSARVSCELAHVDGRGWSGGERGGGRQLLAY